MLDATRPLHTTGCRDDAWLTSDQRLYNILRLVVLLTGKSMCFNIGQWEFQDPKIEVLYHMGMGQNPTLSTLSSEAIAQKAESIARPKKRI